jgi:hypothetical protein
MTSSKRYRWVPWNSIEMVEFGLRLLKGPWATAALVCLAALVVLFALAGQTVNAPFVYTAPK